MKRKNKPGAMALRDYEKIIGDLKVYWDDEVFVRGKVDYKQIDFLVARFAFALKMLADIRETLTDDHSPAKKIEILNEYFQKIIDPEMRSIGNKLEEFISDKPQTQQPTA